MRFARLAIAIAAVALLGAACGGGDSGGGTTDSVTMVDNEFQPSSFTASDTITVTNDGQALHSFTVTAGGIDQDVEAGQSSDIDLSGLDAGSHDFMCKYHPEMTGSVTIQ